MSNITMADLKKAEAEEAKPKRISNPRVGALRQHMTAVNGRV